MIRDPRDMIVSGYFYHRWCEEIWANSPDQNHGGKSYRERLNSLGQEEGLTVEMERFSVACLAEMRDWNYEDPAFIEVKYEDAMRDSERVFRRIFAHYGFDATAIDDAMEIVRELGFTRQSGRKPGDVLEGNHLRSGKAGQWQEVFSATHRKRCKELMGQALIDLGYEDRLDW
ncbi:MAG: sulfotransferase domain-containing protein [Pseudomonadota bacterium]